MRFSTRLAMISTLTSRSQTADRGRPPLRVPSTNQHSSGSVKRNLVRLWRLACGAGDNRSKDDGPS
jgi:hypothetical protein